MRSKTLYTLLFANGRLYGRYLTSIKMAEKARARYDDPSDIEIVRIVPLTRDTW